MIVWLLSVVLSNTSSDREKQSLDVGCRVQWLPVFTGCGSPTGMTAITAREVVWNFLHLWSFTLFYKSVWEGANQKRLGRGRALLEKYWRMIGQTFRLSSSKRTNQICLLPVEPVSDRLRLPIREKGNIRPSRGELWSTIMFSWTLASQE